MPHPFNGTWWSFGRNKVFQLFKDGTIDLEIEDNHLVKGYHTPVDDDGNPLEPIPLSEIKITTSEIIVEEATGKLCRYHGFLLQDPFESRKITAGGYRIPMIDLEKVKGSEGRIPSFLAQENGVWVATQP